MQTSASFFITKCNHLSQIRLFEQHTRKKFVKVCVKHLLKLCENYVKILMLNA